MKPAMWEGPSGVPVATLALLLFAADDAGQGTRLVWTVVVAFLVASIGIWSVSRLFATRAKGDADSHPRACAPSSAGVAPWERSLCGPDGWTGFGSAFDQALGELQTGRGTEQAELGRSIAATLRGIAAVDWRGRCQPLRLQGISPRLSEIASRLPPDDAVELIGLATFSMDGRIRESAVRALGRLHHPRAVPYVLLRLGDWVVQVREAAEEVLQEFMLGGAEAHFIEHHELVEHLCRVGRVDLGAIEGQIRSHLRSERADSALQAGLAHRRPEVRRFCLRLMEDELSHRPDLVDMALSDRSALVRTWFALAVARGKVEPTEAQMLALLGSDDSRVVAITVQSLPPTRVQNLWKTVVELTMHDSKRVRDAANFIARKSGAIDVAALCRTRLASSPGSESPAGVIACLGETGLAADWDLIAAYGGHARREVRAAALTALGRMDLERSVPMAIERLRDPSGEVRKAAVELLRRAPEAQWGAAVLERLQTGGEVEQRAAFRALVCIRDAWGVVPALLHGLRSSSPDVRQRAWGGIKNWQRVYEARGWLVPTPDCRGSIAQIWPLVRDQPDVPDTVRYAWEEFRRRVDRALGCA